MEHQKSEDNDNFKNSVGIPLSSPPKMSDQVVKSEDDFDFNLNDFSKFFKNSKIYLRSEPYLPVGKTIRTFVQGCQIYDWSIPKVRNKK